jgi:hypothetical protein
VSGPVAEGGPPWGGDRDQPTDVAALLDHVAGELVRDIIPSFRNALRRWYSRVLGLMNS